MLKDVAAPENAPGGKGGYAPLSLWTAFLRVWHSVRHKYTCAFISLVGGTIK